MTLTEYFISNAQLSREWASDRNTVSPEDLTPRTRAKVWWRCRKGHEWQAALDSRVNLGRGCPICANQTVIAGENDMSTTAPEVREWWHPTKNGSLSPGDITAGSKRKVWWRCEKGHEWQSPAYCAKGGLSCPYCSGKRVIPGQTDLATTHPQVLELWSPENELLPTELSAGSQKRVRLVCRRGHEWETRVDAFALEGCGCPYCAGKRAIPGETDLATLRPDLMEQWDYDKNTADPRETTAAAHDKVWWKCSLGHSWQAAVFSRTRENAAGCPYCTGKKVLAGFNDLQTLKPKLAQQWYQPLNGELKPDQVTPGSNKKVWWRCSDGHVWQAFIYARTKKNGTGCPVCAGTAKQRGSSAAEQQRKIQPRKRAPQAPAGMNIYHK